MLILYLFQALNLILLTSSELSELRDLLKQSLVNIAGKDLFLSLYASWCHSPMAIMSLCFLAQVRNCGGSFSNYFPWGFVLSMVFFSKQFFSLRLLLLELHYRHISMLVLSFNLWSRKTSMWSFWFNLIS